MLLMAQMVKNPPARLETWVWSLGWEYPLEKGMGNPLQHSEESPWTEEPWGCKELDMTERLRTGKQNSGNSSSPNGPSSALSPLLSGPGFWTFYSVLWLDLPWHQIKQRCLKFLKPALTTQFFPIIDDNYYVKHLNQILVKLGGYATQHRGQDDDVCCISSWAHTIHLCFPACLTRWTKKCKPVCCILFFHFLHFPELHSHILRKGLMN